MRPATRHIHLAIAALAVVGSWSQASHAEDAASAPQKQVAQAMPAEPAPGVYAATPAAEEIATYEDVRPNRPLLTTGLIMLGATYGASAIVASQSERDEDRKLYIPVMGPWLDLANRDCSLLKPCDHETRDKGLLIASGIAQGVGLIATLSSFFVPERRPVVTVKTGVQVTPTMVGGSGYGLSAIGTF